MTIFFNVAHPGLSRSTAPYVRRGDVYRKPGRVHHLAEIASQAGIDKRYVSRLMTFAFLSPDITESIIMGGSLPISVLKNSSDELVYP